MRRRSPRLFGASWALNAIQEAVDETSPIFRGQFRLPVVTGLLVVSRHGGAILPAIEHPEGESTSSVVQPSGRHRQASMTWLSRCGRRASCPNPVAVSARRARHGLRCLVWNLLNWELLTSLAGCLRLQGKMGWRVRCLCRGGYRASSRSDEPGKPGQPAHQQR
jgi:hypothetical protein